MLKEQPFSPLELPSLERLPADVLRQRLADAPDDAARLPLLTALGWVLAPTAIDDAEACTTQARRIAAALHQPQCLPYLLRNEAHALIYRSEYAQALIRLDEAERQAQRLRVSHEAGLLDLARATAYFHMGEHLQAQQASTRALAAGEAEDNVRIITSALSLLGSVAVITEQYPLAISCFERCIPYYEARDYTRGLAKVQTNLGQTYLKLGQYAHALTAAERAQQHYESSEPARGLYYVNTLLGEIYTELGDFGAARHHRQLAYATLEALQDATGIAHEQYRMGDVERRAGDPAAAIRHYEAVLKRTEPLHLPALVRDTHLHLADCYEALGNDQAALRHHRQFHALDTALRHEDIEARLRQSQWKLEAELAHREAEIQRLRADEAQHQLEHADRLAALGKLASGIAHEINNPLQVIYGNLLLLSEGLAPEDSSAFVSSAVEQIERIVRLIAHMREMYQFEGGEDQALDLSEIVTKVLLLTRKTIERQHIRIDLDLAADLPLVLASSMQMQQVVLNLLLNAVDAMPQGGVLRVSTGYAPLTDEVTLSVVDSGQGIAPELLSRVFDPFFTTREEGSGLGLPICQNIVRHYGGRLTLASTPGEGTRAQVRLPLGQPFGVMEGPRHEPHPGR